MHLKPFAFEPYSRKQLQALTWWMPESPYRNWDGIIADGSIRSGKTISEIDGFIEWSRTTFSGENFIVSGKSMNALKRNVIAPMRQILAAKGIAHSYNRSEHFLEFGDNTYFCFGANTEASQDVLQGLTAAGWYGDEVALQPQSFIEQAIGRCSVDGSKYWLNCNPENPTHHVKTELIDKAREKRLLHRHFTLDDNLTLSAQTKERYGRMFSGVWHKRMILGLWVAAQGAIYDMLDESVHVVDKIPEITDYYVGVDYGTAGVTTFWLLGIGADNRLYFVDFFRWDAKQRSKQLTDWDALLLLDQWLQEIDICPKTVVIPGDAVSFAAALRAAIRDKQVKNVRGLAWADMSAGSVVTGLRDLGSLFSRRLLLFTRKVQQKDGLREWIGYTWDQKASDAGVDKPLKLDDHDCDSGRYAVTHVKAIWSRWTYASTQR